MSKLLISGRPVMIIPELALKLGLHEAVVLQQIHYWLCSSKHVIEGRKWIYNTYKEWHNQMPFWSESTIKRTIRSLEKQGFLLTGNWNSLKIDKTKWYTIDYERVVELQNSDMESSIAQIDQSSESECSIVEGCLTKAIPESTSEITTEITTEKNIIVDEAVRCEGENTSNVVEKCGEIKKRIQGSVYFSHARFKKGDLIPHFEADISMGRGLKNFPHFADP
ncbi:MULTISPECIES: hypothetical protein [unclassified Bacillus (in: firmicutes)]|uniref:hypothetical protein n=1 Tax=unclassified Bacillus (in: firmicutes) TaxID=185979 RepID=UPI0008EFF3E7|nr:MULTISPECIES: hypothetical protein [unclassified Bacillus (in: firmicutes)]SFB19518.1 hypothetical protein SAMN02799634_1084 [Bacillus sp. UNCCL13]SFQ90682.1 hypothetical protein SAMN04488577_3820 [Bacillus sp. cl95]